MQELFNDLKIRLAEIAHLGQSLAVLGWDQQTYMPSGGAVGRGNQMAILGKIAQEYSISPELGEIIEKLKKYLKR